MYLEQSGNIRLMDSMPTLTYSFSKYDEEARQKLIDTANIPPNPDSRDAQAWRIFIRSYQTDAEEAEKAVTAEALSISAGAAAALVAMVETGELTRDYGLGSLCWRTRIMPVWHGLLAAAK